MTKSETQIAEENIKNFKYSKLGEASAFIIPCKLHKTSCQRFLEFLDNKVLINVTELETACEEDFKKIDVINKKITDLKQAIKLYSENGI